MLGLGDPVGAERDLVQGRTYRGQQRYGTDP